MISYRLFAREILRVKGARVPPERVYNREALQK
jgi:hypothetical protein